MILTLISQAKLRVERTVNSVVRRVILTAAAATVLLFAAGFGLVAAYYALIDPLGFRPIEAAGIVGGSLLALGLVLLAALPLAARTRQADTAIGAPTEALALVDRGMSNAMRQVGPLPLVVVAFAAGFLATKR